MPRTLAMMLVTVALLPPAVAQSGQTKADLEQQRKAAEKAVADRTKEYEKARKEAGDRLGDDLGKYQAKRKELDALRQFQRKLLDDVPWVFTRFTDGKADKPEMLTFRKLLAWVDTATKDREAAVNDDLKAKTLATEEQYKKAMSNFKELILDPLVKAGPASGSDTFARSYDDLVAAINELEQGVVGYEKKLGDTAKRLADTQAAIAAAVVTLAEAEGRLTGRWRLDKVILFAEDKEQVGSTVTVWNQKTDLYWKTDILSPTGVINLGRKYLVSGEFTPPPALLEPGKPFDVTFQGRFSKSEEDVGWPGVLLDVLAGEASPDPKVKENMGYLKATLDGKKVDRVVFEVNPKRQSPSERYTFTAPAAEVAERPLWRFMIRGWNTPDFAVVYQYKWLK